MSIDIGRILGPSLRRVVRLSNSDFLVFESLRPRDPIRLEKEISRALDQEGVQYRGIEVRDDGIENHGLMNDQYIIVEAPISSKFYVASNVGRSMETGYARMAKELIGIASSLVDL